MPCKNILELGTLVWVRSTLPAVRYHVPAWLRKHPDSLARQAAKKEVASILEEFLEPCGLKELRAICIRDVENAVKQHGVKTPWDRYSWYVPDGLLASLGRGVQPHVAKFDVAVRKAADKWEADLKEDIPNLIAAWAAAEHIGKDLFGFTDSTEWIRERSHEVMKRLPSAKRFRETTSIRVVASRAALATETPGITSLRDEGLEAWTEEILDTAVGHLAEMLAVVRDCFTAGTGKASWAAGYGMTSRLEKAVEKAAAWDIDQEGATVASARAAAQYLRAVIKAVARPEEGPTRKKLCDALLVPLLRISDVQAREARLAKLASIL
jgi:hypothetical protein